MANVKTATAADFKTGSILKDPEGYEFIIMNKYDNGIWEAKSINGRGSIVMFENEARFYTTKEM